MRGFIYLDHIQIELECMNKSEINTLPFTSLLDTRRELSNDISSFVVDGICDEELNIGVFDDGNNIGPLFTLSNGLRDGIAGGVLSPVDGIKGAT
jgi:hypothetical protein